MEEEGKQFIPISLRSRTAILGDRNHLVADTQKNYPGSPKVGILGTWLRRTNIYLVSRILSGFNIIPPSMFNFQKTLLETCDYVEQILIMLYVMFTLKSSFVFYVHVVDCVEAIWILGFNYQLLLPGTVDLVFGKLPSSYPGIEQFVFQMQNRFVFKYRIYQTLWIQLLWLRLWRRPEFWQFWWKHFFDNVDNVENVDLLSSLTRLKHSGTFMSFVSSAANTCMT